MVTVAPLIVFLFVLLLTHRGLGGLHFISVLEAGPGSRMRGDVFIGTFHLHLGPVQDGMFRSRRLVRSP